MTTKIEVPTKDGRKIKIEVDDEEESSVKDEKKKVNENMTPSKELLIEENR